jgi:hypothetical protein
VGAAIAEASKRCSGRGRSRSRAAVAWADLADVICVGERGTAMGRLHRGGWGGEEGERWMRVVRAAGRKRVERPLE